MGRGDNESDLDAAHASLVRWGHAGTDRPFHVHLKSFHRSRDLLNS